MGMFDRLAFEDGFEVEFPDIGADPSEITWQTRSIARHQPTLENYKITADGRLFRQEADYEHVPEEDRPDYNEETDECDSPVRKMAGSRKKIHQSWSDTEYHGIFEFHGTIDGDYVSLEAKFTDGKLVAITPND